MAQIIVLTSEAKTVLQPLIFERINQLSSKEWSEGSKGQAELDTLHRIYSDVVGTSR